MSTIRADNFGNRAGTSQITADTLVQGTTKAWFNINGTGVIASRDSFNCSSFTDVTTGRYTSNFSVAMPNVNYAAVSTSIINSNAPGGNTANGIDCSGAVSSTSPSEYTVNACRFQYGISNSGTANDVVVAIGTVNGDPV